VVPTSCRIASTGDYYGNGRADILWRNDDGRVSIWDDGQISTAHVLATISNDWQVVLWSALIVLGRVERAKLFAAQMHLAFSFR
jgi:hypothetical protein